MEQENSLNIAGDGPTAKVGSPLKNMSSMRSALQDTSLISNISQGGALQQLTDFLNLHAKGTALSDFKGDALVICVDSTCLFSIWLL